MNLFVYGTLRDPERVAAVCGRVPPEGRPATLRGFVRHDTRFGWPVVFPVPDNAGARVDGWVWAGVTLPDLAAMDAYEDHGEAYVRREVRVETSARPVTAWVYIGIPEYFRDTLL